MLLWPSSTHSTQFVWPGFTANVVPLFLFLSLRALPFHKPWLSAQNHRRLRVHRVHRRQDPFDVFGWTAYKSMRLLLEQKCAFCSSNYPIYPRMDTLKVAINCRRRLPMIRSIMITVTRPIVLVKSRWYAFIGSSDRKQKINLATEMGLQGRLSATIQLIHYGTEFAFESGNCLAVDNWSLFMMISHRWAFCQSMVLQFGLTGACVYLLVASFAESFVIDYKPQAKVSLSLILYYCLRHSDRQHFDK